MTHCANCGMPFDPPPSAEHKRFCSARCRGQWHGRRKVEGMRLLREREAQFQARERGEGQGPDEYQFHDSPDAKKEPTT